MSAAAISLSLSPPRLPPRTARRITWARGLDVAVILAVVAGLAVLVVRANDVLGYRWNWSVIPTYLWRADPATGRWAPNILLLGFFTTIRLAVWSLLIGTFVGTLLAAMRVSGRPAFRWLARCFVELYATRRRSC